MRRRGPKETFEALEERPHTQLQDVERELLGEDLAPGDVDAEAVMIAGTAYQRVLRDAETYMEAAGPVRVEAGAVQGPDGRSGADRCADGTQRGDRGGVLDANGGTTTGLSQMTPQIAAEMFAGVGNMRPSKEYPIREDAP